MGGTILDPEGAPGNRVLAAQKPDLLGPDISLQEPQSERRIRKIVPLPNLWPPDLKSPAGADKWWRAMAHQRRRSRAEFTARYLAATIRFSSPYSLLAKSCS